MILRKSSLNCRKYFKYSRFNPISNSYETIGTWNREKKPDVIVVVVGVIFTRKIQVSSINLAIYTPDVN